MDASSHAGPSTGRTNRPTAGPGNTPIWQSSDLIDVQYGDRVDLLGAYELEWDEDCLKPSDLEPWRFDGDDMCDEVVRTLNLRAGMDGLEKVKQHLELPVGEQAQCVRDFWEEIIQLPPDGISALPTLPAASVSSTSASKPHSSSLHPPEAFSPIDTMRIHNLKPPPTLPEGQAVFWRYAAQIFASLLHFSLAGGFAAERIMGVLHETGYLVGGPAASSRMHKHEQAAGKGSSGLGSDGGKTGLQGAGVVCPASGASGGLCPVLDTTRAVDIEGGPRPKKSLSKEEMAARDKKEMDRTYRRLLETTQAVMEYMYDMTPITGTGWQSAIRVRMLHSAVRVRIADKRGVRNTYDATASGVPINQEDLIMTLGSFAVSPMRALYRMGFRLNQEEKEAYIAAWRHVGFYLGISPVKLRRHFSSLHRAERLLACTHMHLFSYDATTAPSHDSPTSDDPSRAIDPTTTSTYKLLLSACHRPPFNRTIDESLCLARILLGDGMADRLALPPASWARRQRTIAGFRLSRLIHVFGGWYKYRIRDIVKPDFWLAPSATSVSAGSKGDTGVAPPKYPAYSWETERVHMSRVLTGLVIWWQMDFKKARFTVNEHSLVGEEQAGDLEKPALLETGRVPEDEGEREVYMMNEQDAKRAVRKFKGLMLEMGAVMLMLGGLGGVAGYSAWRIASNLLV